MLTGNLTSLYLRLRLLNQDLQVEVCVSGEEVRVEITRFSWTALPAAKCRSQE